MPSLEELRRRRRTNATPALPSPAARPSPSHGAIRIAATGSCFTGIASVDAITELIRRTTDEPAVFLRDTPVAAPPFPVEPETAAEPALPRVGGTPAAGTGRGTPPGTDTSPGPGTAAAAPGRAAEPAVLGEAEAAHLPGEL